MTYRPGRSAATTIRDPQGYVDLTGYAAIGDGRTVALIAPEGRVDRLPVPDLDSVPAFGALLDAEHGGFVALAPVEDHTATQHYEGDTNVLVTEFRTATGSVRVHRLPQHRCGRATALGGARPPDRRSRG